MKPRQLLLPIAMSAIAFVTYIKFSGFTSDDDFKEISSPPKTLVLYAYFEKNAFYIKTLRFFIQIGVQESTSVDYLFIIQGGKTSVDLPAYANVRRFNRSNDCFDFGAYGAAINWLGGIINLRNYTHFIFINPSTIGPLLPKHWPSSLHWTSAFISNLKGNVHAIGTSIVCLPYPDKFGGKCNSFFFFN
jgi:hypothetical protein